MRPESGWDPSLFTLVPMAQRNGKFIFNKDEPHFNYLERELSWENIQIFPIQAQLSAILYKQLIPRLKVRVGCQSELQPSFPHIKFLLPKLYQLPKT